MRPGKWLEISLVVDEEQAEAVAEVLARFIPQGVAIESTAVTAQEDDSAGRALGPWRVRGYLPAEAGLEDRRQRLEEALWYLGRIRPLPPPQYRWVKDEDWAEAWKEHYRPIPIGRRLLIVPAWLDHTEEGRISLRIEPGMAFGTGTHPTTQLCLEWIEAFFERPSPSHEVSAIDLGCGTAILAIAALKLGAWRALGVDIDPLALEAARQNALLNGVSERLELVQGSLEDIRQGSLGLRQAPLLLANILAPVLVRFFNEGLADLLAEGGYLVLSGILEEQADEVAQVAQRHGLSQVGRTQKGDWVALCYTK